MNILNRVIHKILGKISQITYNEKESVKYHQYITDMDGYVFYHPTVDEINDAIALSSKTTSYFYVLPILDLKDNNFKEIFKKAFPELQYREKSLDLSQPVKSINSYPLSFTKIQSNAATVYDFSLLSKAMFGKELFGIENKTNTINIGDVRYMKHIMLMYHSMGFDLYSFNINYRPLPRHIHEFVGSKSIWFHQITFKNGQNIIIPYEKTKN